MATVIRWSIWISLLIAFYVTPVAYAEETPLIKVRILDTKGRISRNSCFISSDGSHAVIGEGGFRGSTRFGLWNLDTGKLVRYLSAEVGKGTATYAGNDEADFGARIQLESPVTTVSISMDGKLAVGLGRRVHVWELATGKLVRELENRGHPPRSLRFIDDKRIVAPFKASTGIELIDAASGERKTLLEGARYASYGGSLLDDDLTFVSASEIYSLSTETGVRVVRSAIPPDSSRAAPTATWYSRDGSKFLIQREGRVEVWDTSNWKKLRDTAFVDDQSTFHIVVAPLASLVAIQQQGKVELWDAVNGSYLTLVVHPKGGSLLCAMSDDARRMIFSYGSSQTQALVAGLDDAPTKATIDVVGQMAADEPIPTR
jgi:WD40 repeat protein